MAVWVCLQAGELVSWRVQIDPNGVEGDVSAGSVVHRLGARGIIRDIEAKQTDAKAAEAAVVPLATKSSPSAAAASLRAMY